MTEPLMSPNKVPVDIPEVTSVTALSNSNTALSQTQNQSAITFPNTATATTSQVTINATAQATAPASAPAISTPPPPAPVSTVELSTQGKGLTSPSSPPPHSQLLNCLPRDHTLSPPPKFPAASPTTPQLIKHPRAESPHNSTVATQAATTDPSHVTTELTATTTVTPAPAKAVAKTTTKASPSTTEKIKRYRCCYCDRAFSRSEHRSRHERSHTKERPFHCTKCPSTFVRRDLLLRHDRTVHAKTPKTAQPVTATSSSKSVPKVAVVQASKQPDVTPSPTNSPTVAISIPLPKSPTSDIKEKPKKSKSAETKKKQEAAAPKSRKKNSDITNLLNQPTPLQLDTPKSLPSISSPKDDYKQMAGEPQQLQYSVNSTSNSLTTLARAASADSKNAISNATESVASSLSSFKMDKRPRENEDDEFNAALLMTELHQSLTTRQTPRTPMPATSPEFNKRQKLNSIQSLLPLAPQEPPAYSQYSPPQYPIRAAHGNNTPASNTVQYPHISQSLHTPQLSPSFPFAQLIKYFQANTQTDHLKSRFTQIPTKLQLNRYLASYFLYFHPTLPFLHPHVFVASTVAPPLLFGVCSIGALLCHETDMSVLLHNTSRTLISSIFEVSKDYPQKSTPLWTIQTLITCLVYRSWSGDVRGLEFISSIRPTVTSLVKVALDAQQANNQNPQSWSDFVDSELVTRAFYAVFVIFGSLTAIYNYPCQISTKDIPLNTPLPCSEAFWNSADSVYIHPLSVPQSPKFHQALDALRNKDPARYNLSPFAIRVLGTAIFQNIVQFSDNDGARQGLLDTLCAWDHAAVDPNPGQGQAVSQFILSSSPMALTLAVDDSSLLGGEPSIIVHKIRTLQHPLIIEAYLLSLVSQIRLLVDMPLVRESIRFHVPHDISSAAATTLSNLMNKGSLSSPQLTPLVARCFDMFRLTQVAGQALFKSSGAGSPVFMNCPEALACFFEASMLVIMWCYRYEVDNQQQQHQSSRGETEESYLYGIIERTCIESGLDLSVGVESQLAHKQQQSPKEYQQRRTLASALTLVCADILESSTTWGIADIMSLSMRSFAYKLLPPIGPKSLTVSPTTTPPPPSTSLSSSIQIPPVSTYHGTPPLPSLLSHHRHQQTQPLISNLRTPSGVLGGGAVQGVKTYM